MEQQTLSPIALRALSPRVRQLMGKIMPPDIQSQTPIPQSGRRVDYAADKIQSAGRATRQRNRRNAG